MNSRTFLFAFFLKIFCVESRMIPNIRCIDVTPTAPKEMDGYTDEEIAHEKVLGLKSRPKPNVYPNREYQETDGFNFNNGHFLVSPPDEFKNTANNLKKCAVLVISNQGHLMQQHQSLIRKYRYNKNGDLIPSSVQYFIKFPQGSGSPVLVPLKDKAFSATGGFVRYYKEVPPIPQSWKR